MKKIFLSLFLTSMLFFQSCGENKDTDIVESGTYTGVAEEVDPGEKEIYVRTDDDKLLELYFTDSTELMRDSQKVDFDQLKENGKVQVTVEKKGNKLVPISVKIVE